VRNRQIVLWVRLAFYAEGVAVAVSLLCFIILLNGGGDIWRRIARFCVISGATGVCLLVMAHVVGVRMVEGPQDKT
jgi:hypothetical protein